MMKKYPLQLKACIFILTALLVTGSFAGAQDNTRECIRLLRDKETSQVLSAIKAYGLLDTLHPEQSTLRLAKAADTETKQVQTRVKALNARFLFYWLGPGDSLYAAQMNNALTEAYALDAPFMIAEFSRWYGEMLNSLGNKPLAAQYCMNALKMQQELGFEHFYTPKTFYLTTAEMLYQTINYNEACRYYAAAFQLPDDSIAPKQYGEFKTYMAHSLNAYGRAFNYLKKYDSSLFYLQRCMQYVQDNHLPEDLYFLASDNRFDPMLELGQFDSCRKIAQELYKAGLPSDTMTLLAACIMEVRIALRNQQPDEAIKWGQTAEKYGATTPKLLFNVYKDMAAAYDSLGQKEKAALYLEKWHGLEAANNTIRQKASAAFLEAESDFQKSKLKLTALRAERERQVRNRNLLIAALVLVAVIAVFYFRRRHRRSQKALHQAEEQFHFFETRYRNAAEQLAAFKTEVEEKNRQIELLEAAKQEKMTRQADTVKIDALSRQIILTEKDWELFRESFDAVYPQFFTALKIQVPDITNAEIRMACLIRLNFDSKHIAGMLGISQDSVRKTRYRLKKRFGEDAGKALEDIIAGI